jgi:hypothetical protein
MPLLKLYRKSGKKYKTELRPSRIEILILPLIVCFLLSIFVWSYATGHNRPEPETTVPAESCTDEAAEPSEESLPAETEARPSDV